jgi:hypothetical protein
MKAAVALGAAAVLLLGGAAARKVVRKLARYPAVQAAVQPAPAPDAPPQAGPPLEAPAITELLFDSATGLSPGWMDYGWSTRTIAKGAPARVEMGRNGGWIIAAVDLKGSYGGLAFDYLAPAAFGDFLDVRLDTKQPMKFPRVHLGPSHQRKLDSGWTRVFVPLSELNPAGVHFDVVVLSAGRSVGSEPVQIDHLGLTSEQALPALASTPALFTVDCSGTAMPISPLVYGIGTYYADQGEQQWKLGATARRWGGDLASRYNWELGNTWNLAHNWFFRNARVSGAPGFSYETFFEENRAHQLSSALTVPTLGWVAKDSSSYSFPVSLYGPQQSVGWDIPDSGNGVLKDGTKLRADPTRTSIASPPESIERWVRTIGKKDKELARGRSVALYFLDNEPNSWALTHRDVHPEPTTYDELLAKTLAYGEAVRRADPDAVVAGPSEWGWLAINYSAKDTATGVSLRPDRRLHGDVPLLPWYLKKIREHEKKTGTRVLDVVDVHFYSTANNVGIASSGGTDPATNALRLRATRSLWDPTYTEESWVNETIQLVPTLRRWIDENAPGLGISIGEWNFGADTHMSGGLAAAEMLGRLGSNGVTAAFYWTYPPDRSPVFWAFRSFRNFDGAGARFLDLSVPARAETPLTSIFASRDQSGGHVVAVLLNLDPRRPRAAQVGLGRCGKVVSERAFVYTGGDQGPVPAPQTRPPDGSGLQQELPPYSITILDLQLEAPARR